MNGSVTPGGKIKRVQISGIFGADAGRGVGDDTLAVGDDGDVMIALDPERIAERTMPKDPTRFAYIDALRGYAILGVIAVHSSQLFPGLEWPLRLLVDQGARGVQLFFVVSALTLMLSWYGRADGTLRFWIRRIFRIVPMFWLALAYYAVLVGALGISLRYWGPTTISWRKVFASAMLIHGFHPEFIESIVPGGWSIADEAIFYLLFPLFVWALRSWPVAAVVLVLWTIGTIRLQTYVLDFLPTLLPLSDKQVVSDFASLWFPYQALSFIVGILAFHLLRAFQGLIPRMALQVLLAAAIMAAIGLPFFAAWHPNGVHRIFFNLLLMYSLSFGIAAFCLAQGVGRIFVHAPIRYIGRVSYSAYFWHFAVIELIGRIIDPSGAGLVSLGFIYFLPTFLVCAALTMLGATLTFYLVEAPLIRLGHKLAAHRQLARAYSDGIDAAP